MIYITYYIIGIHLLHKSSCYINNHPHVVDSSKRFMSYFLISEFETIIFLTDSLSLSLCLCVCLCVSEFSGLLFKRNLGSNCNQRRATSILQFFSFVAVWWVLKI